ncbi:hypothetical protein QYM36_015348, partial [Artemia franciscana]
KLSTSTYYIRSYFKGTNIVYSCRPGYWLHGPSLLVCRSNGCWDPIEPPVCVSGSFLGFSDFDSVDVSSGMTLLVAVGTASCVICILAIVWLLISCIPRNERYRRRELRNPLSSIRRRAAPSPPQENREGTFIPSQRPDIPFPWDLLCPRRISNPASPIPPSSEGSQVSVDPDRLALIAFAEGVQQRASLPYILKWHCSDLAWQSKWIGVILGHLHMFIGAGSGRRTGEVTLPSYEDAVRERAPPPYDAVVGTFRGVIRSSVAPMALRTVRTGRRSRTGGNLQNRATERIDNSDSVSQHSAFSGPFFPNRCGGDKSPLKSHLAKSFTALYPKMALLGSGLAIEMDWCHSWTSSHVTLPSYEDAVRERAPPPYDAVVGTFRGVIRSSVAPMALRTVRTGRRSRTGGNLQNRATERIDNSDSNVPKDPCRIDLQPPSFADILRALKNLKHNKEPGEDGISAEMYKGSLRTASYAGSIGSLDTVAASEGSGSTVVTHASDATSYSASSANSQTASTRGVCGSLASFDTLSMQNNEEESDWRVTNPLPRPLFLQSHPMKFF